MTYRMIQIGVGGYGKQWLEQFTPPNTAEGLLEVVGIADTDREALRAAQTFLGLPDEACFSSAGALISCVEADFALISTPAWHHEEHINLALDAGLDILCEKPVADTMAATIRLHDRVMRSKKKLAMTMTHRFDEPNTTFRNALRSGIDGPLDYLVFRQTGELRKYGAWGAFRHELPDAMLAEAAIHHFDMLRDLAGADCATVFARSWTPPWGEFKGDANVMAILTFANGVKLSYEGTSCNAVAINPYFKGYVRAECESGVIILNHGRVERHVHDPARQRGARAEGQGETIAPADQAKFGNIWLIERFVNWLDGGEEMETSIRTHLQSQAMVFAAIESVHKGREINVQDFLAEQIELNLCAGG
jgi:predicted dehydrogenase